MGIRLARKTAFVQFSTSGRHPMPLVRLYRIRRCPFEQKLIFLSYAILLAPFFTDYQNLRKISGIPINTRLCESADHKCDHKRQKEYQESQAFNNEISRKVATMNFDHKSDPISYNPSIFILNFPTFSKNHKKLSSIFP